MTKPSEQTYNVDAGISGEQVEPTGQVDYDIRIAAYLEPITAAPDLVDALKREVNYWRSQAQQLEAALRAVEWGKCGDECDWCGKWKVEEEHKPGCPIGEALK